MTQTRDLIKKMADFFTGEEFYEKGEDARLELSPNDVRCMNEVIKACGNAISRQAVLNLINADWKYEGLEEDVSSLSPVTPQPKTGWIPCNERLPEDRREVLVTAYWHETYQVMMASYYGDGLWWCVPFNNCGEHMQRLNPKAWMPLPKPYKAESEDKGK